MSDKEKLENIENVELESIDDDELDKVSGGSDGLNPPRVKLHPYEDDEKSRM